MSPSLSSGKTKSFIVALFVVLLFILVSYFTKQNIDAIQSLIGNSFAGILIYILITIFAIVFAPVSMMPLVPVAANVWGIFYSAIFNIIGWAIGSFIVFFICRKYGKNIIKKFVSLKEIEKIESQIPKRNVFFGIVILRMTTPVDILSYALSLLTRVDFKTYAFATIIGIIPFAFAFSYLGTIPFYFQILGFFVIGLIIVLILEFYRKKFRK